MPEHGHRAAGPGPRGEAGSAKLAPAPHDRRLPRRAAVHPDQAPRTWVAAVGLVRPQARGEHPAVDDDLLSGDEPGVVGEWKAITAATSAGWPRSGHGCSHASAFEGPADPRVAHQPV